MPVPRAISLSFCPGTIVDVFFCPPGPTHVIVRVFFSFDSPAFFGFPRDESFSNAFEKLSNIPIEQSVQRRALGITLGSCSAPAVASRQTMGACAISRSSELVE